MNTSFKVNTAFSALDYVVLVDQIAAQHFDNGEYAPHLGLLNTMKLFYDNCVTECPLDAEIAAVDADAKNLAIVTALASNSDFIEAFNAALVTDCRKFDFANAYADAMKIVDNQKSSMWTLLNIAQNAMNGLVAKIAPALTPENLTAMQKIAKGITENTPTAEAVVKAYADSELLKARVANKE